MDLNERFQQPNPIGLNDRFVQSTFQPVVQRRVAPIETGVVERIKSLWNPVGETIRDLGAERVGKILQPDTIVVNGKRQATENKTFNNLSADELNSKLTDLTASSKKDTDGILYKLKNPSTGEIKYGKAGDDVWTRYNKDIGFQENWIVEYQRPMKDIDYAERLIHGNKGALEKQAFDFGKASQSSLNAGGTEIYKTDPLSKQAVSKVQQLLSPEQKSLAEKVYEGFKIKTGLADIDDRGNKQQQNNPLDILKNMNKARLEFISDNIIGANLGTQKAIGGLADLIGDQYGKEKAQRIATASSNNMIDKEGIGATTGEIIPEFMLPAVLKTPAVIKSLAGRIGYGALTGAGITGGYEKLKEQSGIKEGLETNVAIATGVGGIVGGIVGGLTKNPELGKAIGESFEAGDSVAREAILNEFPEARSALREYTIAKQREKKDTEKQIKDVTTIPKKVEVKGKSKEKQQTDTINPFTGELETTGIQTIKTKRGVEQQSVEVNDALKELKKLEYDVLNPKAKEGKPLSNQKETNTESRPYRTAYEKDSSGRFYADNELSIQGDNTSMATLRERVKPEIKSASEEVSRRMELYKHEQDLMNRYGETQANYKPHYEKSQEQIKADEIRFERDQYLQIAKDKQLSKEIRNEAYDAVKELANKKVFAREATDDIKVKAEESFLKQFDIRDSVLKERELETKAEYQHLVNSRRDAKDFVRTPIENAKAIADVIKARGIELAKEAKKAKAELIRKEGERGRTFDETKIDKRTRRQYRDEVAKIEDLQDMRRDLTQFKNGDITAEELQFREMRRIQEQQRRSSETNFKSQEEADAYVKSIQAKYEEIGVTAKLEPIKYAEDIKPNSGKTLSEKTKKFIAEKEASEVKQSERSNAQRVKTIEKYRKTKVIPRDEFGRRLLNEQEIKDIEAGILSSKEIANQKAPIGKNADKEQLRKEAKEFANKKVRDYQQKALGIQWNQKPQDIQYKQTFQDVSNSMAQITAVLLGLKKLGAMVKTAGLDNVLSKNGKAVDIRDVVAETMGKDLPSNFPIKTNKDTVKPMFMTENYGQGRRGLINGIIARSKDASQENRLLYSREVTRKEAEQFLDSYFKSFDKLSPEMVEMKNLIREQFLKGNGKIEFQLPDGFKVKLDLTRNQDGTYRIKGNDFSIKVATKDVDNMSSAILPAIIQSLDAFVAGRLARHGIGSKHDAFSTPAGKTDEFVQEKYGEAMAMINDSDILHQIMRSLGYEGRRLKKGDLSSDAIRQSAKDGVSLVKEEIAGDVVKANIRPEEIGSRKTPVQIVKEFMARNNVRGGDSNSLVKKLINEAMYNKDISIAKSDDDVFERQVALAHQYPVYKKANEIKPPKGVNTQAWDKAQREIFNEARARLESNPAMIGKIDGERVHFTESGKKIGAETKTYHEILRDEIAKGIKEARKLNRENRQAIKSVGKSYEQIQRKVKSWEAGKILNHDEAIAKSLVEEARKPIPPRSQFKKNIDKVKAYFKDQVSDNKLTKDFQGLLAFRKHNETQVALRAEKLKADLDSKLSKQERKDWFDAFLKTDYHAIQELKTANEAKAYMQEHNNVYQIAKDYIDQSAKALGEASEQIGFFRNNARAIVEELNLPREMENVIDKLISIKAMTPKAWKELERVKDSDNFKYVMEIIGNNKVRSAQEFHTNPENMVKGYISEVYNDAKRIDGDKVKYDAETGLEAGAIPNTLERKKVGSWQEVFPKGDFKTLEEKNKFAQENRLKVTREGNFRRVADAELKDKAGRSKDFNEILTATTQSIDAKEIQKLISKNIIDEMTKGTELFSLEKKNGYRKITELEASRMPKVVGDSLAGRYVLEAYDKRLFGRDEVRLYSGESQVGKIADRLLKNTILHFKQNIILKNPKSYFNATLFNQMIATTAGVNPKKLLKYQMEALSEISKTDELISRIATLKATGKDISKLEKELDNSLLYQMEKEGLAINKLEVAGDDSTLLGQIGSDLFGGKMDRLANEAYLSQNSILGKKAFKTFGAIDTQGRYTLAKHFMDNGMNIKDAVQKANGLFGDMDAMAPALIEAIDKYGIIPFAKWASLTLPQLMKLTKDNPAKALGLAIAMYGFQVETDLDYSTVNPLEGAVNFLDSSVEPEFIKQSIDKGIEESSWDKVKTFYTPKVYSEIYKELESDGEHETFIKHQIKNEEYKPLTQRIRGED